MFSQEITQLRTRLSALDRIRKHLIDSIACLERAQANISSQECGNDVIANVYDSIGSFETGVSQRAAIREAIGVTAGEFTSRDVLQYLRDFQPKVHASLKVEVLSNALYKFSKEGFIKQIRQGTRGRPSIFTRVDKRCERDESGSQLGAMQSGPLVRENADPRVAE